MTSKPIPEGDRSTPEPDDTPTEEKVPADPYDAVSLPATNPSRSRPNALQLERAFD